MHRDKIVLATHVLDNADILNEYIEWHLSLNVDFIVVNDFGSSDGSQDILDSFAKKGVLSWSYHPNKSIDGYDPSTALARLALEQHQADWVILADSDEFLCVDGRNLHQVLDATKSNDLSVITVTRRNMTGMPLAPGEHGLDTLNLRIDQPTVVTRESELQVPQIFMRIGPKTIIRASDFVEYGAGAHGATSLRGKTGECQELRFIHFSFRSFEAFQIKARNIAAWMAENPHLPDWWGWHWRRWIRLNEAGQLREDYDNQFLSSGRAQELLRNGICSIDNTVASWIKCKKSGSP